jgi:hypothetical protein
MIPDFTDSEIDIIRQLLTQRYQKDVDLHLADSEITLHLNNNGPNHSGPDSSEPENSRPDSAEAVSCPTVFWHERGANFVVVKAAMFSYRTQFFYTPLEQFGTGIDEYSDLEQCIAAVLQTQSDHKREREGVNSDSTGETIND